MVKFYSSRSTERGREIERNSATVQKSSCEIHTKNIVFDSSSFVLQVCMMMYSSMNLQAMYTGVISKYIQNSSLKVFEEVLVFFFVFFFFFLKKL